MIVELKELIGCKVVSVGENSLTFDNGAEIDFHPYETYVYLPKEDD